MTSSVGLDLELVLIQLDQNNCVVDWVGYLKSAMIEGWTISTIIKKIRFPIMEVYGSDYWIECEIRIKRWFVEQYPS
jgi:hypothetical protein